MGATTQRGVREGAEPETRAEIAQQASNLAGACDQIRHLLASTARVELHTKYRVGEVIAEVLRRPDTFGTSPVEAISEKLDLSPSALYAAATVTRTWGFEEVKALGAKTNAHGLPLAWSHFVELTRVRAKTRRGELLQRCLVEGWSVRELREAINASSQSRGESSEGDELAVRAALSEGLRTARKATADLGVFLDAIQSRLVGEEADAEQMGETLRALDDLEVRIQATRSFLRQAATESQTRLRVAPPTSKRSR